MECLYGKKEGITQSSFLNGLNQWASRILRLHELLVKVYLMWSVTHYSLS